MKFSSWSSNNMATDTGALQESQAPKMYAVFSVFLVLPLIAVGLRLLARRMSNLRLWWDDWLILVATVGTVLMQAENPKAKEQRWSSL